MAHHIVTLRVDLDLLGAIDALADQLELHTADGKPNRSAVIRYVLRRATGTTAMQATLREESMRMQAVIANATMRARGEIFELLAERLRDALEVEGPVDAFDEGEGEGDADEDEDEGLHGVRPVPARPQHVQRVGRARR